MRVSLAPAALECPRLRDVVSPPFPRAVSVRWSRHAFSVLKKDQLSDAAKPRGELTNEDRRILWTQFVEVYAHSQETFDTSVRAMAAAGVGITVSLATAIKSFPGSGRAAVVLFLSSLVANLISYGTAQFDMKTRIACLRAEKTDGIEGNGWTVATTVLNVLAGACVIAAGVMLAIYVSRTT